MQIISRQNSISHLKLKPFAAHNCSEIDSRKWRGSHRGVYSPSLSCARLLFSSAMNFCGCVKKIKKTGAAPGKKRNRGGKALLAPSLRLQAREVAVGGAGWDGVSSECLAESAVKLKMCHGGGGGRVGGGGRRTLGKRNEGREKSGPEGISSNDNVTGASSRQVPRQRDISWWCSDHIQGRGDRQRAGSHVHPYSGIKPAKWFSK